MHACVMVYFRSCIAVFFGWRPGRWEREEKKRNGKKKAAHAPDFCDGTIALQQVADCFCSHVCNAVFSKAARAKCVGKRTTNKLNQEKRGRKTKKTEGKGSRERERKHHVRVHGKERRV